MPSFAASLERNFPQPAARWFGFTLARPQPILWCNRTFTEWCGRTPVGQNFYEALGLPTILPPAENSPFHKALRGQAVSKRLAGRDNRVLELHITPQGDARLLALCRDVT